MPHMHTFWEEATRGRSQEHRKNMQTLQRKVPVNPSGVWTHDPAICNANVPVHRSDYSLNHRLWLERFCETLSPPPQRNLSWFWEFIFWFCVVSDLKGLSFWMLSAKFVVNHWVPKQRRRLFHFYCKYVFLFYLSWTKTKSFQLCSPGYKILNFNLLYFSFRIYC